MNQIIFYGAIIKIKVQLVQ